jgi:hypothetical protein
MKSRFIVGFVVSLFLTSAEASVLLLKSGLSDAYMALNLTDHGDVALSTCPMIANPIADCDPGGQATMVVTRSVFDSKLKMVTDFDQITLDERGKIKYYQKSIQSLKKALKDLEIKITASQKQVGQLEEKIGFLNKQILDVEKKLEDTNLDPEDRKELEAFVKKSKIDRAALEKELLKAKTDFATLEREKKQNLESTIENENAIVESNKKIANRKTLFENKAADLTANLDQKQTAVAYEKESLYFIASFIFDASKQVVGDSGCTAIASYTTSINNVRATLNLTEGVFPKVVQVGIMKIEIYNGLTLDLEMSKTGKEGWNSDGELFDFISPRSKSKVVCDDPNGIEGRKNFEWGDSFGGDLISGDTRCSGKPARRYHYLNIFYVGRMTAQNAAKTCSEIKPKVKGYVQTPKLLDAQFYGGNAYETEMIQGLYKSSAILQSLKVEGHQYLKDGFYSWANVAKPYLWEYTAEKANLLDFRKTEHEKTILNWELPALCYTHQDLDYCD